MASDAWQFSEAGNGRPLVLLHGLGMSRQVWNPILPQLRKTRRVIAFDIAGFGSTPALPSHVSPTGGNLAEALHCSLRRIGVELPVDLAGNSLGGLIALEAAKRGFARGVVAISPPGLWRNGPPIHVKPILRFLRGLATKQPHLAAAIVRRRWLREMAFAIPLSLGSRHMPAADAVRTIEDLARASASEETFEATRSAFADGGCITVPVTVAFGRRDWILPKRARLRDHLPPHTRWIEPSAWGHVPMWVDPCGVAEVILEGAR